MGDPTLGQVAYEGYWRYSGGKSLISGAHLPPWAELDQPIQDAWEAAAIAVVDKMGD